MEIVKVPNGETKESFIKCRINNIKRTVEMFQSLSSDKECFDNDTIITISSIELQLWHLLEKFEGKDNENFYNMYSTKCNTRISR